MATASGLDDKTWYNHYYGQESQRDLLLSPQIVERYQKLPHPELFQLERWHQLIGDVRDRRILYLACGTEPSGILLALRGAEVWAFDLAFEALRHQRKMDKANGTSSQTRFTVGSCFKLPFRSQSFDLVVGIGIWHHLQEDLDTPCWELARILKTGGFAVFQEPIARCPLLARLRKHVFVPPPATASPACRPLSPHSFDCISRHFDLETHSYRAVSRLDRLFLHEEALLEFIPVLQRWALCTLQYIDFLLLRVPGFYRLSSVVIFKLTRLGNALHRAADVAPIEPQPAPSGSQ